jgi:Co/Zn/Cd efflux system component
MDRLICAAIALSMFALGYRLAIAQSHMLLMSYSGGGSARDNTKTVSAVVRDIELEPAITRVDDAQFWQVHYSLGMANLKVRVSKGADDNTLSRLRSRVAALVQNRLGEGYGHGQNLRWEVTLQTSTDPS